MNGDERPDLRSAVERDARRHARREPSNASFWRALSLLGTVGWSIALPAAGGALLGWLLDRRFASGIFLTVLLLVAGVALGSVIAWNAVRHAERDA